MTLDPENASVYKQLYRAAKAKLKLRLRVTVIEAEKTPVQPMPATVEDEEPTKASEQLESLRYLSPPATPPKVADANTDAEQQPLFDTFTTINEIAEIQRRGIFLNRARGMPAGSNETTPASITAPAEDQATSASRQSSCEIPVTRGAAAREKWFAEIAGLNDERQIPLRCRSGLTHASTYSVYCNRCNHPIPDEHYHCGTCDDGDFDLCKDCVDSGELCNGEGHWMIKRSVSNGKVITSTTETLPPRSTYNDSKITLVPVEMEETKDPEATRTCNSCVQEFVEDKFVTCTTCEDFDLCIACHVSAQHGHHPKHAFVPAVDDTTLDPLAKALLNPGRNAAHQAICDGCDKFIYGVRNKCLECPDWDYCADCMLNANFIHPRHRFVPIYEPLSSGGCARAFYTPKIRHHGIYCDGPLCNRGDVSSYIQGERYKCAVCDDYDLCASCEASPSNTHNKTHPLIKFKTPVRNVSVTTMGDHESGPLPIMGDRRGRTTSKSTETTPVQSSNAATQVQTIAEVKPIECYAEGYSPELDSVAPTAEAQSAELVAHFVRDSVQDGTVLAPNTVFEQTWTLRNGGSITWPAGCSVKFVGGDNMCAVDPEHPASVHELVSAAESTTCYTEVAPGQEFGFTVLMRTPARAGKVISYWRLTGPTGLKFGHRLWCDVSVSEPAAVEQDTKEEPAEEIIEPEIASSQLSFPKLEKESPASSVHQEIPAHSSKAMSEADLESEDDFVDEHDEFEDETEDGFMTDDEWDVLDASDEEYLAEQQGKASKK